MQSIGASESPGFGCGIYKISVQVNLSDSDAVFTEYRNIDPSEFPGFGRDIYKISMQMKSGGYLVFNLQCANAVFALSYVLEELGPRNVSRVSAAAHRWCAVRLCEPVGRDRYCAGGVRAGENIQLCTRRSRLGYFLGAAGPVQWPGISLGGRVLLVEIEYSRSRFLEDGLEYPRAEYARRRSSTLDPDFLEMVQNI